MQYTNPVIPAQEFGRTWDPYVLRHGDWYYHCYSRADGVYLSRAKELCAIGRGEEVRVFTAQNGQRYSEWYAPELHHIDGVWYIYGAPLIDDEGTHCMCVLKNTAADPMAEFVLCGMMQGLENTWCIDGTVFEHDGRRWFIWTTCSEMYLSQMASPCCITGDRLVLTRPEYVFETKQGLINEGPAVLKRGDTIYIVYSANDSKTDDYCLGLLTYAGGDILDAKNWEKSPDAVFEKTDEIFGPGHCSFTTVTEEEMTVDYIVYHANLTAGSGWDGRSVWIQPFGWDAEDRPVFGRPHK